MNPFYSFLGFFSNTKIGQTRAHSSLYVFRLGVNCILYYIYEKINIKYTVIICLHLYDFYFISCKEAIRSKFWIVLVLYFCTIAISYTVYSTY
jgi:hypothetical protein